MIFHDISVKKISVKEMSVKKIIMKQNYMKKIQDAAKKIEKKGKQFELKIQRIFENPSDKTIEVFCVKVLNTIRTGTELFIGIGFALRVGYLYSKTF